MLGKLTARWQSSAAGRWYAAKESRERLTLGALAVATLAVLLWAGVWKPLAEWQTSQASRHAHAEDLLDWLRANEARAKAAVKQGADQPSRSILPLVTRAAEARGLKVGRLQPESDGIVSVTLQGQPFNAVIGWVADLHDSEGITAIRASIDAQETAGLVNAQFRLQ